MKSFFTFMMFVVVSLGSTGEALAFEKLKYDGNAEFKRLKSYCYNQHPNPEPCMEYYAKKIQEDTSKFQRNMLSWEKTSPRLWWVELRNRAYAQPITSCYKPLEGHSSTLYCWIKEHQWMVDHYNSINDAKWKQKSNMLSDSEVAAKKKSSQNYLDSIKSTPPSDEDYGD